MVPTPASLATRKALERVRPGAWWLLEAEDGEFWCQCSAQLTLVQAGTGAKLIQLRGVGYDKDGPFRADITQVRDHIVLTLTEAQARRCGLGS